VCGDEADHRDSTQWKFYVVSAASLPMGQRTISLSKIRKLAEPCGLTELADAVDRVAAV
jgi:hypothetical protein